MVDVQGTPTPGPVPSWVARARRQQEPTPAFDAYQQMAARPAASPETLDRWRRRLPSGPDATAMFAELDRLGALVAAFVPVLERAVIVEGSRWEPQLKYPLVKLGPDAFVAWVGSCDAPAGNVMTQTQALAMGFLPTRISNAKEPDPDGYLHNRAGPGEARLTVAAIITAYASSESYQGFRLTPDLVQCTETSDVYQDPNTGTWVHSPSYWDPWAPDAVPDTLPTKWRKRF
ncbi:hypothetical protein [Tessaracoccus sp.]